MLPALRRAAARRRRGGAPAAARARGGLARQRANSVRARLFALVTLAAVRLQARVRGRLARRRADAMRRVRDFARRPAR